MPEDRTFTLKDFNFHLPEKLIAQSPTENREDSKLFVLNRKTDEHTHTNFKKIHKFLHNGDVLVFNNAKVIPARIYFKRESGGLVEIVLVSPSTQNRWMVISNRTKKLKPGEILYSRVDKKYSIKIIGRADDYIEIETNNEFTEDVLKIIGEIPLPPYISRDANEIDNVRYQTVYAKEPVAAASPTAGLHFTNELMNSLSEKGISIVYLTLHVSWGTFQPVRHNDLRSHKMHKELFTLPEKTASEINRAREEKRRIISVGTTSLRVLESTFVNNMNMPGHGETDIFIYPPQKIRSINGLITNFHTPHSTLLMLVSAYAGYDIIMNAYSNAVDREYRFFSYGDSMFIYSN